MTVPDTQVADSTTLDPTRPVLRARAPLRISFAGGGTDVAPFPQREGGAVLSATISSFAFSTLRPRSDGKVTVQSLDYNTAIGFGIDDPVEFDGQLDLPKAAIRRIRDIDGARPSGGFDLFLHTQAPPGSGLGSSSAVMVSVIGLVAQHCGLDLTPYDVAELAYRLEREDLSIPGGSQDQYAAAFGGFNYIEFQPNEVIVNPLRVRDDTVHELEHNMLLAFTGNTRVSDHIIEDQRTRYEDGVSEALEGLRAQKELAVRMKVALVRGEVDRFGELLGQAWAQKRKMSAKISTPLIDTAVTTALRCGALGGKVTGAGGGGHLVFVCEFERRHIVAQELLKLGLTLSEITFSQQGVTTWRGQS
ncbi:GHMP kinase [Rudaeicoccus suwonensis]|uniref:D-glycero-alpha-D-manno-heptose-7-phosphate kinase n=1 Tax=Rudaeicoccus suwonensis TaxID=657409 RepID=A0A561EAK2_9MICO|nr:GHMP kinase [Rudaeicoccus suwonensis]TWE12638.1 D-glycero-alpha-D-manno-heptose-7-phosphate kinase [Rudaeicoccus suwonensis]